MDYDSAYHKLFANPELVEDLFRHFVTEEWVESIDFSTLTRVNAKFHSDYLERREGDMIYRVHMKDTTDIAYLCILMEFQSTPDRWMAVRIMAYIALFYQQLIKEKQLTSKKRLPAVFPLVLYNGDKRWQQPIHTNPLIDLPKGAKLWAYQPRMRYYLIDESRYPEGKTGSLSGILFRLENVKDPKQALAAIDELIETLKRYPGATRVGHDFMRFIQHILQPAMQLELSLEQAESLNEVQSMLSKRIDEWQQQWLKQGITQGISQGITQGEALVISRQLRQRFGELPAWAEKRLANADEETLTNWSLKLFEAKTLEEVLES